MTHPTPSSELQDKLVEILTSIQSATSKASDFALGQLPDIVQSYLAYGRVYTTVTFVLAFVVAVGAIYLALKHGFMSKENSVYDMWSDQRLLVSVLGTMVSFFAVIACVITANNLLLVWIAPKVWLLKELAAFVH